MFAAPSIFRKPHSNGPIRFQTQTVSIETGFDIYTGCNIASVIERNTNTIHTDFFWCSQIFLFEFFPGFYVTLQAKATV